ncbi:MAG: NAD(P)/FAD-dependent oxidoreductase [Thermoleophilia bacterium]|nr:NAD(P)/FAD-dependent oxidoreductase [Thermoleophilia bacterium]
MSTTVVIGGSFAGLTGALEAKRKLGDGHEVILISRTDQFVYIPSLIWVPFGWRQISDISMPIKPVLDKHGVTFIQAEVNRVDPEANRVITSDGEYNYDYLLVASGVTTRFDLVEGLGPDRNTYSVCTPGHAEHARDGWEKLIKDPGPVVIGATQGASCMGAGYEFLFNLEYAARKAGVRDRVDITWITPEPFLGHFGIDGMTGGEQMLKGFMKAFNIKYVLNSEVEEITGNEIVLKKGGKRLPYKYAMIIPPFNGARYVRESGGLGDEKGFIPVDDTYRHQKYPNIFAAGLAVAVPPPFETPVPLGVPKTGFPSEESARIAAHNIARLIRGVPDSGLKAKPWGKIPGLCVMDAGRKEVVIISSSLLKPRRFALMLPNPLANVVKRLLERYFLWKTRKGLSYLA